MYRGHTVGVVIPAYNEEALVAVTIESIPDYVDRIYVVDDGSTDDTWREIEAVVARENERRRRDALAFDDVVIPIAHESNRGVGGAIKTGYRRARGEGIELTAVMGADDQMDPDILETLLDPIVDGRAEYVKGNRFLEPAELDAMPRHRVFGNAVLSALTKIASGYWDIGDPQCGYTAISLYALEEAAVDDMYEFYGYCNDILVKLNVAGLRVVDVPCPARYGEEESHIRYRSYVPRVSAMLLRNFLGRLRTSYLSVDFHPLVVAYIAGVVASGAGLFGLAWALPVVGGAGSTLLRGALALLLLVVGLLSLVAAMALDQHENDHLDDVIRPERHGRSRDAGDTPGAHLGHGDRSVDAATPPGDRFDASLRDPLLSTNGGPPPGVRPVRADARAPQRDGPESGETAPLDGPASRRDG